MKSMITALMALILSASSAPSITPDPMAFNKTTHDFGMIKQGSPQQAVFVLTNTSDEPVILTKVKASCGCTGTTYDKKPIKPGESTEITTTYNAMALGVFKKTVSVFTSIHDDPMILTLSGEVKPIHS